MKIAVVAFFSAVGWKIWPFVAPIFRKERWLGLLLFLFIIGYFVLLTSVTGCTPVDLQKTDVIYRRDMLVQVNDRKFEGIAIVPRSSVYAVKLESQEDVNLLTMNSCHRDKQASDVITSGWFKANRGYTFTFTPNAIESEAGCPLRLGGYNRDKGQHSWGLVIFEHPTHKLDAVLTCNGEVDTWNDGDSACQTLVGLIQQISFEKPVRISDKDIRRDVKLRRRKTASVGVGR